MTIKVYPPQYVEELEAELAKLRTSNEKFEVRFLDQQDEIDRLRGDLTLARSREYAEKSLRDKAEAELTRLHELGANYFACEKYVGELKAELAKLRETLEHKDRRYGELLKLLKEQGGPSAQGR